MEAEFPGLFHFPGLWGCYGDRGMTVLERQAWVESIRLKENQEEEDKEKRRENGQIIPDPREASESRRDPAGPVKFSGRYDLKRETQRAKENDEEAPQSGLVQGKVHRLVQPPLRLGTRRGIETSGLESYLFSGSGVTATNFRQKARDAATGIDANTRAAPKLHEPTTNTAGVM